VLLAPIATIRTGAALAAMPAQMSIKTLNRSARPNQLVIAVLTARHDCNFAPSISPALLPAPAVAARTGTGITGTALLTIVFVALLYPIVDVATWQRLAALAKDTG
jgi:hypothetical protein